MTNFIHPARQCDFADLLHCLELDIKNGMVHTRDCGSLRQYTYSRQCVYERAWTPTALMARGLILNPRDKKVVATPFLKFFNLGEGDGVIPILPFNTYEKVDGSLIIAFHDGNYWSCATKGSFTSDQAYWAMRKLSDYGVEKLDIGTTYLFEAVYRENKIVVDYPYEDLVLLGAYDLNGIEYSYDWLIITAQRIGCRVVKCFEFNDVWDVLGNVKGMTKDQEGFVLHWPNGHRLKVKGEEYLKIHRAISGLTPLEVWRRMLAQEDMEIYRSHLPEELWKEFDSIYNLLKADMSNVVSDVEKRAAEVSHLSDKEWGLMPKSALDTLVFPWRKGKTMADDRFRSAIFSNFRPMFNKLEGYYPSTYLKTFEEESL